MSKNIFLLDLALLFTSVCIGQQSKITDTTNRLSLPVGLKDADKDGVADQFDRESATPGGCLVDTHGVTLDTDGDGISDCRDKEKLTLQYCFPVDSNGIGFCAEPDCCYPGIVDDFSCHMPLFPSLYFKPGERLLKEREPLLDSLSLEMKNHPDCYVRVQAYYIANSSYSRQLANERIQNLIAYIADKWKISKERFTVAIKPGTYINYINIIPINRL